MRLPRSPAPLLVLLLIAALLPGAASAQDDVAYCATLSAQATRYLAGCAIDGTNKPDLETKAAIDDCEKGNTAAGIRVLERKLASNGFAVPRR